MDFPCLLFQRHGEQHKGLGMASKAGFIGVPAQCSSALTALKVLIFKPAASHFYFSLGPANYVAGPKSSSGKWAATEGRIRPRATHRALPM